MGRKPKIATKTANKRFKKVVINDKTSKIGQISKVKVPKLVKLSLSPMDLVKIANEINGKGNKRFNCYVIK